jgi:hypothetical protein
MNNIPIPLDPIMFFKSMPNILIIRGYPIGKYQTNQIIQIDDKSYQIYYIDFKGRIYVGEIPQSKKRKIREKI